MQNAQHQNAQHQNLVGFIWIIANKLRGPYRPPQYRRVMLPLIVLRRFDLVLAENKQKVLDEKKRLEAKGITGMALEKALSRIAATDSKQELYNSSGFTFEKLLGDAPNIAGNLISYIQGFSPRARDIARLQEYRSALITNAVTGKIDVRGFEVPKAKQTQALAHG